MTELKIWVNFENSEIGYRTGFQWRIDFQTQMSNPTIKVCSSIIKYYISECLRSEPQKDRNYVFIAKIL